MKKTNILLSVWCGVLSVLLIGTSVSLGVLWKKYDAIPAAEYAIEYYGRLIFSNEKDGTLYILRKPVTETSKYGDVTIDECYIDTVRKPVVHLKYTLNTNSDELYGGEKFKSESLFNTDICGKITENGKESKFFHARWEFDTERSNEIEFNSGFYLKKNPKGTTYTLQLDFHGTVIDIPLTQVRGTLVNSIHGYKLFNEYFDTEQEDERFKGETIVCIDGEWQTRR